MDDFDKTFTETKYSDKGDKIGSQYSPEKSARARKFAQDRYAQAVSDDMATHGV
jgi:hypothetical protein